MVDSRRFRGFLILAVLLAAAPAGARPYTKRVSDAQWEELEAKYGRYGAVVLEQRTQAKLLFSHKYDAIFSSVDYVVVVVLDRDKAEDALNHEMIITPGTKLKGVDLWSQERGAAEPVWVEKADVHIRKLGSGWQEVRVAVPGITRAGVYGLEIRTSSEGGWLQHDFVQDYPLITGTVTFETKKWSLVNYYFFHELWGDVEEIDHRRDDYTMEYRVHDVPPRAAARLMAARDNPRAEVNYLPRWESWEGWVKGFAKMADEVELPKEHREAARDTLSGLSPREVVSAIARRLDDPANFRLLGGSREGIWGEHDLEAVLDGREGRSMSKALLALATLRELGIDSYLVFGASRHRTALDWRVVNPWALDAVLLQIPAIDEKFIWDIADRTTPIGKAGADLYTEMIVMDPDRIRHFMEFRNNKESRREEREVYLSLEADGLVRGSVQCRYVGWPLLDDLDPWNATQDVPDILEPVLPDEMKVEGVKWVHRGMQEPRCTTEDPALLAFTVTSEAMPFGEAGWKIEPLFWGLPEPFRSLAGEEERSLPVYLSRGLQISERVVIRCSPTRVQAMPPGSDLANSAGRFHVSWTPSDEGITVTRSIDVPSQYCDHPADFSALCRAWKEADLGLGIGPAPDAGGDPE